MKCVALYFCGAVILGLPPASQAAPPFALRPASSTTPYYGPYSVYGPGLSYRQPSFYYGPLRVTTVGVQTSVSVPDRGSALVGGYSTLREGRSEFGTIRYRRQPLPQLRRAVSRKRTVPACSDRK